jgi:UDPglucose--hexose-1-phosphate uridylyltransferase
MTLNEALSSLLIYCLNKKITDPADANYTVNQILEIFREKEYEKTEPVSLNIHEILAAMITIARERQILTADDFVLIDNFKAKIMNAMMDRPKTVIEKFWRNYQESPVQATNYLYCLAKDTDYIQTKRIQENIRWHHQTEFGILELTINLSKPEKDPKQIALVKENRSGYPKCQLCPENEGYQGYPLYESRANMRIIPLSLHGETWYFQYSPYSYFPEHAIILKEEHIPMVMNENVFSKLLGFLDYFPEYFVGSNAELPIVGGSILNHEHFQAGRYHFPIEKAAEEMVMKSDGVFVSVLKWPLSTVRLKSESQGKLISMAGKILKFWREYENRELMIINSQECLHNTITPIARKQGNEYVFELILRNNATTDEYPYGIFHPHANLHHIKKENIGLIEAMGMGILPARLKTEFDLISRYLSGEESLYHDVRIIKHQPWISEIKACYASNNPEAFLLEETGKVFSEVLKDAGVFKMDAISHRAFYDFITGIL